MIVDDITKFKTNESKYRYLDSLDSESVRNKLKVYVNEYDIDCSLELINRIEMICKILRERILQ